MFLSPTVREGWVPSIDYKRGRGGVDLFAIDQSPKINLSSEKCGFKVSIHD